MELVENFLTKNPCYQAGKKIAVKGLMLHSVGCPQPSADVFTKKWNNPESNRACVHAFIDGNTGKVVQTLPWDHRGWHGGGSSNNTHIGVEMCEPACIRYISGSNFSCSDREQALAVVRRTYDAAVELFAMLCRKFGLNPLGDGVIVSHKEGHDRGIATAHGDPDHLWKGLNSGYTMDGFRKDVAARVGSGKKTEIKSAQQAVQNASAKQKETTAQNAIFAPGDKVKLIQGAIYYSGKVVPDWVLRDLWIIKSISGDRVVIDRNESGTSAINSPVNVSQLVLVARGEEGKTLASAAETKTSEGKAVVPTASENGAMQISARGAALVAKFEGCLLEARQCAAGVWTIGYGHTSGVKPGDRLPSKEEAEVLLKADLAVHAGHVNNCVKKGLITFPLTQNQFDALASFSFNCGGGNLQKLVSGRSAEVVAEKMLEYNKAGGRLLTGLVRRREEERKLFLEK